MFRQTPVIAYLVLWQRCPWQTAGHGSCDRTARRRPLVLTASCRRSSREVSRQAAVDERLHRCT